MDSKKIAALLANIPIPNAGTDYDMLGAMEAGFSPDQRGHLPDTFKMPNHMTFSNESVYAKGQDSGAGNWNKINGKWYFTPGNVNLRFHSWPQIQDYFKKYEPNSTLVNPNWQPRS